MTDEPRRYAGNGVSCADALESMTYGADETPMALWWWGCAFKYLWRWPWKNGAEDLEKAKDCIDRLIKEVGRMSFGLRDRDWIDPDERPEPKLTCSDCEHYRECCESCRAGWCMELLEAVHGDEDACEECEPRTL